MHRDILEIIRIMRQNYRRDISIYDKSFLEKSINKRVGALGLKSSMDYIPYLSESGIEADQFFDSLNITYSEFFRNPLTFAILEQWILPKIIEAKAGASEIRVWSSGCALGQEAYSLAMLLDKLISARPKPTRYRILGSDISLAALLAAKKGVYDVSSMRNVKLSYIDEFFVKEGDAYSVSTKIKEHVTFASYDLLDQIYDYPEESIFGHFDLVFCSNLLFYYLPEQQQFIVDKIMRAIAPNGYLATGEAEKHLILKQKGIYEVAPPASVFQKKWRGGVIRNEESENQQ